MPKIRERLTFHNWATFYLKLYSSYLSNTVHFCSATDAKGRHRRTNLIFCPIQDVRMSLFQLVPAACEAQLFRITASHQLLLGQNTQDTGVTSLGVRENNRRVAVTEVIEVTLMHFQIAFVGQSVVWCLHQGAKDMEANSFCFFRLKSLDLTSAP